MVRHDHRETIALLLLAGQGIWGLLGGPGDGAPGQALHGGAVLVAVLLLGASATRRLGILRGHHTVIGRVGLGLLLVVAVSNVVGERHLGLRLFHLVVAVAAGASLAWGWRAREPPGGEAGPVEERGGQN